MAVGELETERLRLVPWTEAHTPALARVSADPEVMRHIGTGTPQSPAEARQPSKRFAAR